MEIFRRPCAGGMRRACDPCWSSLVVAAGWPTPARALSCVVLGVGLAVSLGMGKSALAWPHWSPGRASPAKIHIVVCGWYPLQHPSKGPAQFTLQNRQRLDGLREGPVLAPPSPVLPLPGVLPPSLLDVLTGLSTCEATPLWSPQLWLFLPSLTHRGHLRLWPELGMSRPTGLSLCAPFIHNATVQKGAPSSFFALPTSSSSFQRLFPLFGDCNGNGEKPDHPQIEHSSMEELSKYFNCSVNVWRLV